MTFGVITIADGDWYVSMAIDLALSLDLYSPQLPKSVLTSEKFAERLKNYYDNVIILDPKRGNVHGFEQKLFLVDYSPYERTLYLDCDSLVYRPLEFIAKLYLNVPVGYVGKSVVDGSWYGVHIKDLLSRLDKVHFNQVQGGFLFFDNSPKAKQIFKSARFYHARSQEFGIPEWSWRGKGVFSDELALGLALTEMMVGPVNDGGSTMRFPMGLIEDPNLRILESKCTLKLKSGDYLEESQTAHPAVMHFCTWHNHDIYTRERIMVRLHMKYKIPAFLLKYCYPLITAAISLRKHLVTLTNR